MMVMLMLVFGVIELCWAVYGLHCVGNVAHEATRYAIVRGGSWGTTCDGTGAAGSGSASSMCTASTTDIANYVANRNFPGLNVTANDVCVEYFSSVPSNVSACTTSSTGTLANSPGDFVQVTINYPFTLTLPGLPAYTWDLTSTSQMVIAE